LKTGIVEAQKKVKKKKVPQKKFTGGRQDFVKNKYLQK
jgi:hypothetical protein